jgi:hypothetical protein
MKVKKTREGKYNCDGEANTHEHGENRYLHESYLGLHVPSVSGSYVKPEHNQTTSSPIASFWLLLHHVSAPRPKCRPNKATCAFHLVRYTWSHRQACQ